MLSLLDTPLRMLDCVPLTLLQLSSKSSAIHETNSVYKVADKSLVRLGRKQATATEDFDFHISYL